MKLKEILELIADKKINYIDAIEELKKLKLPEEDFDEYERIFSKMLGKEERQPTRPIYQLNAIPNEMYWEVLQDAIQQVREEKYSPEIAQNLHNDYSLGQFLIHYFLNEAISIVRMNSLAPEEVNLIGQAYYKAMKIAESNEVKRKKRKQIEEEGPPKKINAMQCDAIECVDN